MILTESAPVGLLVDLVALEPIRCGADTIPACTPFTLGVRPPFTTWFSETMAGVLSEWSEQGRVVDLEVVDRGGLPRIVLVSGEVRLALDVESTAHR